METGYINDILAQRSDGTTWLLRLKTVETEPGVSGQLHIRDKKCPLQPSGRKGRGVYRRRSLRVPLVSIIARALFFGAVVTAVQDDFFIWKGILFAVQCFLSIARAWVEAPCSGLPFEQNRSNRISTEPTKTLSEPYCGRPLGLSRGTTSLNRHCLWAILTNPPFRLVPPPETARPTSG